MANVFILMDMNPMFTRIGLFLLTNIAVLALASVVMSLLGVNSSQMSGLLVMAAIFGFGGSIISLLLSKFMAKRSTGAQVIDQPSTETERWLLETVRRQAQAAGIQFERRGHASCAVASAASARAWAGLSHAPTRRSAAGPPAWAGPG